MAEPAEAGERFCRQLRRLNQNKHPNPQAHFRSPAANNLSPAGAGFVWVFVWARSATKLLALRPRLL